MTKHNINIQDGFLFQNLKEATMLVVELVTGSMEDRRFAAIYGDGERLTGVFGLNRPRHVMQYRRQLSEGASWADALEFAAAARAKEQAAADRPAG